MEDKKYFSTPGLSKSQLKQWDSHNPSKFWDSCSFNPNKKEIESNDAMVFGSLCHSLLFEKDTIKERYEVRDDLGKMRSNKKWTAAQAESKATIITTEELEHATKMIEALNKHEIIRGLLSDGITESPFMWHDKEWDIDSKMKLDYTKNTTEGLYILDYKTSSDMEKAQYIDKANCQYDVGFYSRGIREKYGKPCAKFVFIFQSTKDGEENDIRIKVVEGAQLECCEIITDKAVKEIVPKIKEWLAEPKEKIWLPNVIAQTWEISPWYESNLEKGNN